jgi:hypothetical protein
MSKAGNFFREDTPEYEEYKRLLRTSFGIKIEQEGFQVNDFVKKKGEEILFRNQSYQRFNICLRLGV